MNCFDVNRLYVLIYGNIIVSVLMCYDVVIGRSTQRVKCMVTYGITQGVKGRLTPGPAGWFSCYCATNLETNFKKVYR